MPLLESPNEFRLTVTHLFLLSKLRIVWHGRNHRVGAPGVHPDHPFGRDKDHNHIRDLLRQGENICELDDTALAQLWAEMLYTLQLVCLFPGTVTPGVYARADAKDPKSWRKVG